MTAMTLDRIERWHALARAVERVDAPNWTRFDERGRPILAPGGKVTKGPRDRAPDLAGLF